MAFTKVWSASEEVLASDLNANFNETIEIGGDGSDGALDTSGGGVDIDCGAAAIVVKNYTSINIASNNLTVSNTHANGTLLILKSQGNVTISAIIEMGSDGGAAGSAGAASGGAGGDGGATSNWAIITQDGSEIEGQGGVNNGAGGDGGAKQFVAMHDSSLILKPGSGAGGGGGGDAADSPGGAGGAGGGALVIECAGALNFTGTINANGVNGSAGTGGTGNGGGGGGGGAGGNVLILYNTLTDKSGTINIVGGNGAAGGAGSGSNQGGSGGGGGGTAVSEGGAGGAGGGGAAAAGSAATTGGTAGAAGAGDAAGGGGGGGASGWYAILPWVNKMT